MRKKRYGAARLYTMHDAFLAMLRPLLLQRNERAVAEVVRYWYRVAFKKPLTESVPYQEIVDKIRLRFLRSAHAQFGLGMDEKELKAKPFLITYGVNRTFVRSLGHINPIRKEDSVAVKKKKVKKVKDSEGKKLKGSKKSKKKEKGNGHHRPATQTACEMLMKQKYTDKQIAAACAPLAFTLDHVRRYRNILNQGGFENYGFGKPAKRIKEVK